MPDPRTNNGAKVHFSFGNDERVMKSTYQSDFGSNRAFKVFKMEIQKPPKSAEIIPVTDQVSEKNKWYSTAKRDFSGFGKESWRQAYIATTESGKENKALHTRDNKLLRENQRLAFITLYNKDFRRPDSCVPGMSYPAEWSRKLKSADFIPRRDQFISEARQAYQWPFSDRIRLPRHIKSPVKTH